MMKIVLSILFFIAVSLTKLDASVLYTFSESASGVQIAYAGSLNTLLFNPQGGLTYDGRYIEIPASSIKIIDFANFQPSPLLPGFPGVASLFSADDVTFALNLDPLPQRINATSAGGDTFGFYVFDYVGPYRAVMEVPFGYVSGTPISGSMFFDGETLSSLGIRADGGFQVYLPGGESISAVVVPEPGSTTLFILGVLGVAWSYRRKRRCRQQPPRRSVSRLN